MCRAKHRESSLLDFYRNLNSDKYKNLVQLAKKMLSIFSITYICKQTFSIMNMNKQHSSLFNDSLEDIPKISTSLMFQIMTNLLLESDAMFTLVFGISLYKFLLSLKYYTTMIYA